MKHIRNCALAVLISATSLFATDYTWTGGGDNHDWRTPANWGRTDKKYPVSGDRAIFPADCTAEVELGATNNYEAVTQLRVLAGANVRFYAADPSAETRLDLKSAWEFDYADITVEFDHIRVDGNKALTLGSGAVFTAKNGSDLRLGNFTVKKAARVSFSSGTIIASGWIDADSSVGTTIAVDGATWNANGDLSLKNTAKSLLSNGARMKINNLNINGPDTLVSIDNATLLMTGSANLGTATPGGGPDLIGLMMIKRDRRFSVGTGRSSTYPSRRSPSSSRRAASPRRRSSGWASRPSAATATPQTATSASTSLAPRRRFPPGRRPTAFSASRSTASPPGRRQTATRRHRRSASRMNRQAARPLPSRFGRPSAPAPRPRRRRPVLAAS